MSGGPAHRPFSVTDHVARTAGHWMAQEKPIDVNAAIAHWLATALPAIWLTQPVRATNSRA
jgi:hypothetical protein